MWTTFLDTLSLDDLHAGAGPGVEHLEVPDRGNIDATLAAFDGNRQANHIAGRYGDPVHACIDLHRRRLSRKDQQHQEYAGEKRSSLPVLFDPGFAVGGHQRPARPVFQAIEHGFRLDPLSFVLPGLSLCDPLAAAFFGSGGGLFLFLFAGILIGACRFVFCLDWSRFFPVVVSLTIPPLSFCASCLRDEALPDSDSACCCSCCCLCCCRSSADCFREPCRRSRFSPS